MIELDFIDLAWSVGLMAITIGLAQSQNLQLGGQLALATFRTVIQLLWVGYILTFVFAGDNPLIVILALMVMLMIAAITTRNRISQKLPRLLFLVWGTILISTASTLIYVTIFVIKPDSWYDPQYIIPLAGIVIGQGMNAGTLAGERLVSTINSHQKEIETHLSLGASPYQAIARYRQDAIRAALIPTINSMMVVGLVHLPGSITGQLLSGIDPLQAAAYQILVMFMVAFANLFTTVLITVAIYQQFFNEQSQLLINP
ncbi:MAG TPA: iron export ABC transporter permease subunit FetB [Allocoleopsis sp.]